MIKPLKSKTNSRGLEKVKDKYCGMCLNCSEKLPNGRVTKVVKEHDSCSLSKFKTILNSD